MVTILPDSGIVADSLESSEPKGSNENPEEPGKTENVPEKVEEIVTSSSQSTSAQEVTETEPIKEVGTVKVEEEKVVVTLVKVPTLAKEEEVAPIEEAAPAVEDVKLSDVAATKTEPVEPIAEAHPPAMSPKQDVSLTKEAAPQPDEATKAEPVGPTADAHPPAPLPEQDAAPPDAKEASPPAKESADAAAVSPTPAPVSAPQKPILDASSKAANPTKEVPPPPILTGYMLKLGQEYKVWQNLDRPRYLVTLPVNFCSLSFQTWKKRFFVLKDGMLTYYEKGQEQPPFGVSHKGEVCLRHMVFEEKNETVTITSQGRGDRDLIVKIKSPKERADWLAAMKAHAAFYFK